MGLAVAAPLCQNVPVAATVLTQPLQNLFMNNRRYKLYLASGIRLWNLYFKDQYSEFFNKQLDLFEPALIDNQYTRDHRVIPIKIATKDLGEINKCDAVLAYMKMYDTQNNGPAGTDSSWECGYAIGLEKPTIMLVEDLEHLDYYTSQWMITFSIGAILTTSREVAETARNSDKFTHTKILHCESKDQFENKIIEYLNGYYKSIYAREGIINSFVDKEVRLYASNKKLKSLLTAASKELNPQLKSYIAKVDRLYNKIFVRQDNFKNKKTFYNVCKLESERARVVADIISNNYDLLPEFLDYSIQKSIGDMEGSRGAAHAAKQIAYWLNVPAKKVKNRGHGNKKTRPTIFYELFDLVSHHIVQSQKYFSQEFVYKIGAIIEIYNWLNTYAIDDVFDNSNTRQSHKTLHIKFGSRKNALLLGAIGHCLALKILYLETKEKMEIGKELIKSLNKVQEIMYQGQEVDLRLTLDNQKKIKKFLKKQNLRTAVRLYFQRIYGICGAFYEQIGKIAMQSTDVGAQFYHKGEVEEACVNIARLFGLVQMIRNDLGDFIFPAQHSKMAKGMKATSHNDIEEGKLTLPVLYSLLSKSVPETDKKIIIKSFNKKLDKKEKLEVSRIIWESGSIEYCMQFVDYFCKLVKKQYIKYIHETPTRLKWIIKLMDITPLINKTFRQLAEKQKWKKLEPVIIDEKFMAKLAENNYFLTGIIQLV